MDLYKVVREGLRVSKDSYSIKAIEAFYSEKRASDVKKATDSIVVYEQWRESRDPALLESIRQYNEEDSLPNILWGVEPGDYFRLIEQLFKFRFTAVEQCPPLRFRSPPVEIEE